MRFPAHAGLMPFSPRYIQYFSFILAVTGQLFAIFVTIEPDLDQVIKYLPSNAFMKAGSFFIQL
jgi:predicted permease